MDKLPLYYRSIVSLWRDSHALVAASCRRPLRPPPLPLSGVAVPAALAWAAVHAVLAGLRRHATTAALFTDHEADPTRDFQLIASLLPYDPDGPAGDIEQLQRVREAAFWLRWLELTGDEN